MHGIEIYYDGECPFCSRYVSRTRLNEAVGPVALVDLRSATQHRKEFLRLGLDPDKGMIVRFRGRLYGGADAMSLLATLTTPSSTLNRLSAWAFRSSARSRLLYPLLRAGRAAVLMAMGRRGMEAPEGWSSSPHAFFMFAFGVFGVLHFLTYAFRFLTPLYPTTYLIGIAGLLLALFPLSRRAFLVLVAALAVDAVLQAPMGSNHTILKNFFVLGVLLVGAEALIRGESWAWFVQRFAIAGRWLLIIMYFFGIFHKINEDFLSPDVSCAVELWRVLPLPDVFAEARLLHWLAIYGTFVAEAVIAVCLLVARWRYVGILLGIAFHAFLGLSAYALYPAFSTLTIALHCLFLSPYAHLAAGESTGFRQLLRYLRTPTMLVLLACYVAVMAVVASNSDYRLFGIGWLLVALPLAVAVGVFGRDDSAGSAMALSRHSGRVVPVAVAVLFFLNCTTPYLGLKTAQSLNMFANLRLEGGVSNHLIMSWPPVPFGYLNHVVEITDSGGHPYFSYIQSNSLHLVYHEFRQRMHETGEGFPVAYRLVDGGGFPLVGPGIEEPGNAWRPHSTWVRKWFHFYPVDLSTPKRCGPDR